MSKSKWHRNSVRLNSCRLRLSHIAHIIPNVLVRAAEYFSRKESMTARSHHGCARCKRRRQKCDEKRPSCSSCVQATASCEYLITLKWDGRVPRKQAPTRKRKKPVLGSNNTVDVDHLQLPDSHTTSVPLWDKAVHFECLDPLGALSSTEKLLLHHFVTQASLVSSHPRLRDQLCQQILPMAHHSSSLMYATMAFSALHRLTLLNGLPEQFIPEEMVSHFLSASLRHLRKELRIHDRPKQPLLHTIRTLCHCEIYSGKADSSWRVHVNGARAIFEATEPTSWIESEPSHWLWARWCLSIQALTAVTDHGFPQDQDSHALIRHAIDEGRSLDIYTGYSSDLNVALMEIGAAARRRQLLTSDTARHNKNTETEMREEADRLDGMVQQMIRRDTEEGLEIPTQLALTADEIRHFSACNTAYQHAALIHLYRRVQGMGSRSDAVQECVRKILDVVCSILPITALSPWVLLATPIYTAGCEALGEDRCVVKDLLLELYATVRIRNILRAIKILDDHWEMEEDAASIYNSGLHGERSGGKLEVLDFIPY